MSFTSHGHQVPNTMARPRPMGQRVARCGGPGLCDKCSREAAQLQNKENRPNSSGAGIYRTRAATVEAMMLSNDNAELVAQWCGGEVVSVTTPGGDALLEINLPTLGGVVRAQSGNYIVRGANGGFYVRPAEVFDAEFEGP